MKNNMKDLSYYNILPRTFPRECETSQCVPSKVCCHCHCERARKRGCNRALSASWRRQWCALYLCPLNLQTLNCKLYMSHMIWQFQWIYLAMLPGVSMISKSFPSQTPFCMSDVSFVHDSISRPTGKQGLSSRVFPKELLPDPVIPRRMILDGSGIELKF